MVMASGIDARPLFAWIFISPDSADPGFVVLDRSADKVFSLPFIIAASPACTYSSVSTAVLLPKNSIARRVNDAPRSHSRESPHVRTFSSPL